MNRCKIDLTRLLYRTTRFNWGYFLIKLSCSTKSRILYLRFKEYNMKSITIIFGIVMLLSTAETQAQLSPFEQVTGKIDDVEIVIEYWRPSVRGRKIFGGLVPYYQRWQTGANAPTSIEVSRDLLIEGQHLRKGKYGLYTIPGEKEWTIIINDDYVLGGYQYTERKDVLRAKVKPVSSTEFTETFTILINENQILLKWENTQVLIAVATK